MSDDEVLEPFDGEQLDLEIPGSLDGIRIDRVLSMLTGLSRSEASELLTSGAVKINEKVVLKASRSVEEGEHLLAILPTPDDGFVAADPTVEVDVVFFLFVERGIKIFKSIAYIWRQNIEIIHQLNKDLNLFRKLILIYNTLFIFV